MAALAVSGAEQKRDERFATCPGLEELILGPGGAEGTERLAFWRRATGGVATGDPALELRLARDILAQRGAADAVQLRALRGPMLSSAAAALRAGAQARPNGPEDALVETDSLTWPFRGFFALGQTSLRHRLFNGGMSGTLQREVFLATDAVTVLPYDPRLDLVLMVEQFRTGPWLRGEARPWLIEAVAGRIDAGETPEEAARREAREEAGIELGTLFSVADYYPSPGANTEYIWSLVALADLSAERGGLHGLEAEGEDIRSHVVPFDEAMQWLAAGRLANAPLILSLIWLKGERERLREAAAGG